MIQEGNARGVQVFFTSGFQKSCWGLGIYEFEKFVFQFFYHYFNSDFAFPALKCPCPLKTSIAPARK